VGVLAGLQKQALGGLIRTIGAIVGAAFSFGLLYCHLGIAALALGNLIGTSVGGMLALVAVVRARPGLRISLRYVTKTELAALWDVAGYFQLVRIAYIIALNTDPLIIARFLGVSEVTPYVITGRLAILFSIVLADKAPSAVYPALAQMFAAGEWEALKKAYLGLVYYSTRLALIGAVVVALLNPQFVGLWVGPQGFGGASLNYVFVYWVLLDTILRGTSIIPLATGDMKAWALASFLEALLNAGASLLLVHWLGIVGVALGTAIARTVVTGVFIPTWSCRKIGLRMRDFLLLGVASPAMRSLPGLGLTAALAYSLPVSLGWFRLVMVGGAAVVVNITSFEGIRWLKQPTRNFRTLLAEILKPQVGCA
jgi:O-antigen/teichoic acid export membrane protein